MQKNSPDMSPAASPEPVCLAYLASEYPAISHTFIHREVEALRAAGFEVATVSVRPTTGLERLTPAEQQEAAQTLRLLERPLSSLPPAHLRLALRHPVRYLRLLAAAAGMARHCPWVKAFGYFLEAGLLQDWLCRRRIRHVHVHFGNAAANVAMLAAATGLSEFSMSVHGPDIFYDVGENLLAEKARAATFVRCISHFCSSQMLRLMPYHLWDRFPVVRCGVDTSVFAPRPEPGNPVPEILCVGRLVPAKGQHILIEACARLARDGVPFHLAMVGAGPDQESLTALAAKLGLSGQVTFTGALGQAEVRRHYDRADLFVIPSFAEGVPVVLMEAMAKEVPVISTVIAGIPELIESGTDGILVPPADPDALAAAIASLLADPARRRELGRRGRDKVLRLYDLTANGAALAQVFRQRLAMEERP
jgi:glycosyltransferase involved in cell wall biosynthesis